MNTWNDGHTELLESLNNHYGLLRESDYALVADVDDNGACIGIEGFQALARADYLVSVTDSSNWIPLNQITKIRIPDGAKSIAEYAFAGFRYLKEVIIPDSVVLIEDGAFYDCHRLDSIDVWKGCTILEEFPSNVKVSRHGDSLLFEKGPAGGIVFYDRGEYSDGWRYLEAAPSDLYINLTASFPFGYYRKSPGGYNLYVNGTTTYEEGTSSATDGKSTGTAIGTGKANTAKLVDKMGSAAYLSGSDTTADYAAKLCARCRYKGFDDWFLPSKDELNLMYENLKANGLGEMTSGYYWSSSENYDSPKTAMYQNFINGDQNFISCGSWFRVRPVRAF